MSVSSFRAVIAKVGVNPFVEVPARLVRAFAPFAERGRIRVAGAINGHPLHATLLPTANGAHRLYVNGGMRAGAGVDVGGRVRIDLRPLGPDEVDVPQDLARARSSARGSDDASTLWQPPTAASSCDPSRTRARRRTGPHASSARWSTFAVGAPRHRATPSLIGRSGSAENAATRS